MTTTVPVPLTEEQALLHAALTARFAACKPEAAWDELGAAGVWGITVPIVLGGAGLGIADAAQVIDVLGERGLITGFLENCVLAPLLLADCVDPSIHAILRGVAQQGRGVVIAGLDERLRGGLRASPAGEGWQLDGMAPLALDAGHAAVILVCADSDGAPGLFVVDGKAAIVRRRYFTIDGRSAADLSFEATPARAIRLDAADLLEAARYTALACLAVEAAALMRRLVSDTAAYVRQREQFGKPLFTFQVVQHRVVDMEIEVRRTGAIARRAIAALEEPPAVRLKLASAAKVTASRGGRFVGQQAVQLHGAMGMTQELAIGRLFKRLTVIENELCSVDEALRRFAAGS